jgi:adenosylcobinamide kinase/adenosylcobinamide-phosphate guanylyltransferase
MYSLFLGGIKSGKSKNAEEYTLNLSHKKPYYLATTEFIDSEMEEKIQKHKAQRADKFLSIEEPLHLFTTLQKLPQETILIECVSMWINNMLYHGHNASEIQEHIKKLLTLDANLVFVLNDVSCSVVSQNKLTRDFVNISGSVAQILAKHSQDVFHVHAGISVKIK